jgi:hypothetical protein
MNKDEAKILCQNTLREDSFFQINKQIFQYLNQDWELCGFLSYLLSQENYFSKKEALTDQGEFFNKRESIKEQTGISLTKQQKFTNTLIEEGIIKVTRKGQLNTNYYKINYIKIIEILSNQCIQIERSSAFKSNAHNKKYS